jgi:hypothetical protein
MVHSIFENQTWSIFKGLQHWVVVSSYPVQSAPLFGRWSINFWSFNILYTNIWITPYKWVYSLYIQYILHVCAQRFLYFSKFSEIAKVGKFSPYLSCCRISWIRNISTRNTTNFAKITHVSDTSKSWRKQQVSCSNSDCWVSMCWLDLATQNNHEFKKKVSQRLPSSGRPLTYQLGWESKYPIDGDVSDVLVSVSENIFYG